MWTNSLPELVYLQKRSAKLDETCDPRCFFFCGLEFLATRPIDMLPRSCDNNKNFYALHPSS